MLSCMCTAYLLSFSLSSVRVLLLTNLLSCEFAACFHQSLNCCSDYVRPQRDKHLTIDLTQWCSFFLTVHQRTNTNDLASSVCLHFLFFNFLPQSVQISVLFSPKVNLTPHHKHCHFQNHCFSNVSIRTLYALMWVVVFLSCYFFRQRDKLKLLELMCIHAKQKHIYCP